MKKFLTFILASAIALTASISLAQQNVTENGLNISVKEDKSEITGFSAFYVEVKNTSTGPKTLNGKITLKSSSGDSEIGSCTVYLEVPAGESVNKIFQCKGAGYGSWNFKVIKVYNFISK
jgi:hypothetical protein